MTKVYRGRKARVAGGFVGVFEVAVGVSIQMWLSSQTIAGPGVGIVIPVSVVLLGLLTIGKALFQSDYRIIVNLTGRGEQIRIGRRLYFKS